MKILILSYLLKVTINKQINVEFWFEKKYSENLNTRFLEIPGFSAIKFAWCALCVKYIFFFVYTYQKKDVLVNVEILILLKV